jgi:hypothetical protein
MRKGVFERCFKAADRWLTRREGMKPGDVATDSQELLHIGYRCGWANGYERAKRESQANPDSKHE